MTAKRSTVNTVLGPVPAAELGVVAVHEELLSVLPGAQYAFDIVIDRAEVFAILAARLTDFRAAGGGTIVDRTGMFHGRDLPLYEALARSTGVHIVASTGLGPEELLGGYFLTPQTSPPVPWPAEKFADLFTREVSEGMTVPRLERRAGAGLVATAVNRAGRTATEESLLRGAARAARSTGVPVSVRYGNDAPGDLQVILDERLPADRVVVGGLDRQDAVESGMPAEIARRGAYVALDHAGTEEGGYITDRERADLVAKLAGDGYADRILLSGSATGVSKGQPGCDVPYSHVLSTFVPLLHAAGLGDADVRRILAANPRDLLTLR
jgi:phosphotriesterase-related protein